MDAMRLDSYSKALAEFPDDSATVGVLDKLVKARRAEYEPKIPEMGELLQMIRDVRNARKEAQDQAKREAEHAAYLKDQQEHPENYFSVTELLAEFESRRTKEA